MSDKNIIFGLHAVEALMIKYPDRIIRLSLLQSRQDKKLQKLIDLANTLKIKIELVSRETLDKLTQGTHHQGAVALYGKPRQRSEKDLDNLLDHLSEPPFLLILDG